MVSDVQVAEERSAPACSQEREAAVYLAPGQRDPRLVDEQQGAPFGLGGQQGALRQRLFPRDRVGAAPGEHLEGQPGAGQLDGGRALDLGGLARSDLGVGQIAGDVRLV